MIKLCIQSSCLTVLTRTTNCGQVSPVERERGTFETDAGMRRWTRLPMACDETTIGTQGAQQVPGPMSRRGLASAGRDECTLPPIAPQDAG